MKVSLATTSSLENGFVQHDPADADWHRQPAKIGEASNAYAFKTPDGLAILGDAVKRYPGVIHNEEELYSLRRMLERPHRN